MVVVSIITMSSLRQPRRSWSSHVDDVSLRSQIRSCCGLILVIIALVIAAPICSLSAPRDAELRLIEPWSGVFAGQKATFHVEASGMPSDGVRIGWRLSTALSTVARGEVFLQSEAPTQITIDIPPAKPGVVMPWILQISVATDESETTIERALWAFPENPFENRTSRFAELQIGLFDPEGKTAGLLEQYTIPYHTLRRSEDVATATGLVLIAEGLSLRDHRGLVDAMIEAASNGATVLCLAPLDGDFVLPGTSSHDGVAPSSLILRQSDIINQLDKRLDATIWQPGIPSVISSIGLQSYRQSVSAVVSPGLAGWPWIDITYTKQGRLVFCGFGIIKHWETTPSARWLFTTLLEQLTDKRSHKEQGDHSNE